MDMPTLISASSKITGVFKLNVDARVDGEVIGKVESDKTVVIGTTGYVKGFVRAENLIIFGRLEGNFVVTGATILHSGCTIFGTLYTKVIDVKEGAIVTAQIVTYDKLKPFEEAQIHLAEEMISVYPIRMNIPLFSSAKTTFDDNTERLNGEYEPVFLMQEETLFSPEPNLPADVIVTATDHRNCAEEANPKSILKSVIFPSLLEQAVKEDFNYLINELGNLDNQVKTLPVQTESKRKGHSTFGLKKLRNFLSRTKFHDEETVEKEYDRINGNLHKVNDSEICNKPKGQEKSEISLSDSIKQLSATDYSSLFQ